MLWGIIILGANVFFWTAFFILEVKKTGFVEKKRKYLLLIPAVAVFPFWLGIVQNYISLKTLNLETEFSKFEKLVVDGVADKDAIQALGELKDPRGVEILVKLLKDSAEHRRRFAATSLGELGDVRAVEPLIKVLQEDTSSGVKEAAINSLGKFRDKRSIIPLVEALKDSGVRDDAGELLLKWGDQQAIEPMISIFGDTSDGLAHKWVEKALVKSGKSTFYKITSALDDRNENVRQGVANVLGKLGDSRAVEPLISSLRDENIYVQKAVINALGELGDSRAVMPLISTLNDEDENIQEAVINALGKIGDSRALEPLVAALRDEDEDIRQEAARALGKIGNSEAISALESNLQDWGSGMDVARALNKLGWKPQSVEDKVHFLVAMRKGDELKQIWDQARQVLIKDVESNEPRTIANALFAFIGIGKVEIIQELKDTLNKKGTKNMAEAYLNCGNKELDDAAREWAMRRGYTINSGRGAHPISWGSM